MMIPEGPNIVWVVASIGAYLAFAVPTTVSVMRSRAGLNRADLALWLILTVFLPVVGAILWIVLGRTRAQGAESHRS